MLLPKFLLTAFEAMKDGYRKTCSRNKIKPPTLLQVAFIISGTEESISYCVLQHLAVSDKVIRYCNNKKGNLHLQ